MAGLTLKGVKKSFGKTEVIHGVDFEVNDGEFCVFVGPSGCGKSTLLRLIAGLEEITEGTFSIGDVVMNDVMPSERGIGMVFQSYALYPHMTVEENMSFGLKIAKMEKSQIKEKVLATAKTLQLENLLDRKPKELSGGQRQRVAIGRALVRRPKVFLFDEPLSNLDAALRVQMRVELAKLHQELRSTIIYVTHDQVEAMTLANKIVVLSDGSVEQIGTPLELYYHPSNIFVAGFIGSPKMNFLNAKVKETSSTEVKIEGDDGSIGVIPADGSNLKVGEFVTVGIRPENVEIEGQKDCLTFQSTVEVIEHLGESSYIYAETSKDKTFIARVHSNIDAKVGDKVDFCLPNSDVYLFDKDQNAVKRLNVNVKPLEYQLSKFSTEQKTA